MTSRPALVYATAAHRADVDHYLRDNHMYRWDDLTEYDAQLDLPPVQRPFLRRLLWLAEAACRQIDGGEAEAPSDVVIDDLSSLGSDRASQVAVIGALFDFDLRIHLAYAELPQRWYFDQREALKDERVDDLSRRLQELDSMYDAVAAKRPELTRGLAWFLPSSLTRSAADTTARLQTLVGDLGLSPTQAAEQLSVEGYPNRHGRVRWYTKAARDAFEAGR